MIAICIECGQEFNRMPHQLRSTSKRTGQRFCSKSCFYKWHIGENHQDTKKTQISCDYCSKKYFQIPSHIRTTSNYCSMECASKQHGDKIRGEKHPYWKGGRLGGRGIEWEKLRIEVIKDQQGKCAKCDMTENEHRLKYNRSFDVHHKHEPFRLTQNNSKDNLEALCIKCHHISEKELRQTLKTEDLETMKNYSKQLIAKGYKNIHYGYNNCPRCFSRKSKVAKLCMECKNEIARNTPNINLLCSTCSSPKSHYAEFCKDCYLFIKRSGLYTQYS